MKNVIAEIIANQIHPCQNSMEPAGRNNSRAATPMIITGTEYALDAGKFLLSPIIYAS